MTLPAWRAISIRQPWASLILLGAKRFEVRSWPTHHRGPLIIHASSKPEPGLAALCRREPFRSALRAAGLTPATLSYGALIGIVEIINVLPFHQTELRPADRAFVGRPDPSEYLFELAHPTWIDPAIPCKGQLGLWPLPLDHISAIRRQYWP